MSKHIIDDAIAKLKTQHTRRILEVIGASLALSFAIVFFFCNKGQFSGLFTYINASRGFIIFLITLFAICNFAFPRKKFYDWLWRKRYFIAGGIFIVGVALKISGSSLLIENQLIQPNSDVSSSETVTGVNRSVRSDEYTVSLPQTLSQMNGDDQFQYFSPKIRATDTDVFMTSSQAPILDIIEIGKPTNWGYLFLGAERGYSFFWLIQIIGLFMVSLEFGMIITKKNRRLSVAFAFLVALSPAVSWWFACNFLLYGQLAVVLLYHYFDKNNHKIKKFLFATGLVIATSSFAFGLYPAWEIPFAILFGLFGLVIIIQKIRHKQIHKFDILMLLYFILGVGGLLLRFYLISRGAAEAMTNTVYPGFRSSNGGGGWSFLLNYGYNIFYPFLNISDVSIYNLCENSTFLSLFPLPFFVAIILLIFQIKNRQKIDPLFCILLFVGIFFSIFVVFGLPEILAKITFLSSSTTPRMAFVVAYICVCLIATTIAQRRNFKLSKKCLIFTVIFAIIYAAIVILFTYRTIDIFRTRTILLLSALFISIYCILYLLSDQKRNKIFVNFTICITIIAGGTVNPVICGIAPYTQKPLAQKIKALEYEDEGNWIATNSLILQNYALSQGVPVINSVNAYPNLELLKKLDPNGSYSYVYNRYAHIVIQFTQKPTYFELIQDDAYTLYLNPQDLSKMDVKYIVSPTKVTDVVSPHLEEKYNEDGVYIYKVSY